jgi:hypothetical protein
MMKTNNDGYDFLKHNWNLRWRCLPVPAVHKAWWKAGSKTLPTLSTLQKWVTSPWNLPPEFDIGGQPHSTSLVASSFLTSSSR